MVNSFQTSAEIIQTMDDYDRYWTLAEVEKHADQWTNALLDGKRGRPLAISRVAVVDHSMVGAALFREEDDIPLLDLLYVLPGECRNPEATEGKLDSPACVLDTGNPCRYDGLI